MPRVRRLTLLGVLSVGVLLAACEKAETGGPPAEHITAVRFGAQRWRVGFWRGVPLRNGSPVGSPFYEEWTAPDDSTYVMHRFADSLLTQPRDSAQIVLRGGRVLYRGPEGTMPAIGIASRGVDFFPEGKTRGGVTFDVHAACTDTLAVATAACVSPLTTAPHPPLYWWSTFWHTGLVVFGTDFGPSKQFGYVPAPRPGR